MTVTRHAPGHVAHRIENHGHGMYEPPYTWITYRASRGRAHDLGLPACGSCGCELAAGAHSPRCPEALA